MKMKFKEAIEKFMDTTNGQSEIEKIVYCNENRAAHKRNGGNVSGWPKMSRQEKKAVMHDYQMLLEWKKIQPAFPMIPIVHDLQSREVIRSIIYLMQTEK